MKLARYRRDFINLKHIPRSARTTRRATRRLRGFSSPKKKQNSEWTRTKDKQVGRAGQGLRDGAEEGIEKGVSGG